MAAIQVISFTPGPGSEDLLAWRYRDSANPEKSDELGTWSQLVVGESQEAILFRNGQALDLFGPGRYTLSTANVPLLSRVVNLPFGGESPFKAEVWFVNKVHVLDVKWGTAVPLQLQDPKYGILLPVRSYGQFGLRVEDSRKFLIKLVGALPRFDREALVRYFRGLLLTRAADLISTYLVHKRISVVEVNAFLDEISDEMLDRVRPLFAQYGIDVVNFFVNSINIPEEDPAVAELKKTLTERAKMEVLGYSYQQMRSFDALDKAASNEGGGSLINAGLGLGIGVGMGGPFGKMAGEMGQNLTSGDSSRQGTLPCPKCGQPSPEDASFCSRCGEPLPGKRVCPKCGASLREGAKFCSECGQSLVLACPSCGGIVPQGAKFCPECGKPLGDEK
ncbi:SPFH domain-containing protein [Aminivibrio sp.]